MPDKPDLQAIREREGRGIGDGPALLAYVERIEAELAHEKEKADAAHAFSKASADYQAELLSRIQDTEGDRDEAKLHLARVTLERDEAVGLLRKRRFIGPACDAWDIQVRAYLSRLDQPQEKP